MSYEKAKKYLNKFITQEEFEAKVKDLENLDIPFEIPQIAPGTVIPLCVIIKQLERDEAERRHQEVLQAISKNKTTHIVKPYTDKKRGPTRKTQERFEKFKLIKDTFPNFSYEAVAIKASNTDDHQYSGYDVRNAYIAMGVGFTKGERSR